MEEIENLMKEMQTLMTETTVNVEEMKRLQQEIEKKYNDYFTNPLMRMTEDELKKEITKRNTSIERMTKELKHQQDHLNEEKQKNEQLKEEKKQLQQKDNERRQKINMVVELEKSIDVFCLADNEIIKYNKKCAEENKNQFIHSSSTIAEHQDHSSQK